MTKLQHSVLAIALPNKLARIAWVVLNKEHAFKYMETRATASQSYGQKLVTA